MTILKNRYIIFAPLLLAAFFYLSGLALTDLWTPDEPRYAEVAREMIEQDNYFLPHVNYEPYTEKPPLFFWMVAGFGRLFGEVNQYAARLPSALAALGTIALMLFFLKEYTNRKTTMVAGLVLATSPLFFWMARSGHIDMLLVFLVTASLVCFYRWHQKGGWWYMVIFYACLALATYTKGPVGMLLPLLACCSFLVIRKEWCTLNRMRLYIGLPLAAAAVLVWYLPASQSTAGFSTDAVLWRQILGRMFSPADHTVPLYYWPFYQAVSLFWGMAPWSVLVPFAAVGLIKYRKDKASRADTVLLFLLCWAGSIFIFFTLIAAKREIYILPMYPAAAALIGIWVSRPAPNFRLKTLRLAGGIFGIALAVLALGILFAAPTVIAKEFPEITAYPSSAALALWAVGACVAAYIAFSARNYRRAILATVGSLAVTFGVLIFSVLPWVNEFKSPRSICESYLTNRSSDSQVAMWEKHDPREEYIFYTKSKIAKVFSPDELQSFFSSEHPAFCFIREKDFAKHYDRFDFPLYLVSKERVSSRIMLLLCSQKIKGSTAIDEWLKTQADYDTEQR